MRTSAPPRPMYHTPVGVAPDRRTPNPSSTDGSRPLPRAQPWRGRFRFEATYATQKNQIHRQTTKQAIHSAWDTKGQVRPMQGSSRSPVASLRQRQTQHATLPKVRCRVEPNRDDFHLWRYIMDKKNNRRVRGQNTPRRVRIVGPLPGSSIAYGIIEPADAPIIRKAIEKLSTEDFHFYRGPR